MPIENTNSDRRVETATAGHLRTYKQLLNDRELVSIHLRSAASDGDIDRLEQYENDLIKIEREMFSAHVTYLKAEILEAQTWLVEVKADTKELEGERQERFTALAQERERYQARANVIEDGITKIDAALYQCDLEQKMWREKLKRTQSMLDGLIEKRTGEIKE